MGIDGLDGKPLAVQPALETMLGPGVGTLQEQRSLLRIDFTPPTQQEGSYTIRVKTGLRSTAGQGLDQDPTTPPGSR